MTRKITDEEFKLWVKQLSDAKIQTPVQSSFAKTRPKPKDRELASKLDLHGLTLNEALQETAGFILQASASGRRKITIITGRSGQIFREFPHWLERDEISPYIHSFKQMAKNPGAWAIRLCRE